MKSNSYRRRAEELEDQLRDIRDQIDEIVGEAENESDTDQDRYRNRK